MKIIPFTKNRQFITEHLERAKKFHCPISVVYEYDVTDLLSRIESDRANGRGVSLVSVLVKATALVMQEHPRMNHHLFKKWFKWFEVDFGHVNCTLVVLREGPGGEEILFPILIRDANTMTVEEIYETIKWHKTAPIQEIPQIKAFETIKKMSWLKMKFFNYKARSDPGFYDKYFGTYGLSSMVRYGWGPVAGNGIANTASGFVPAVIRDVPVARDGAVVIRKIMNMGLVADHFLLDGADIDRGMNSLRGHLENTALLD